VPKVTVTTAGRVTLQRRYFRCPGCGLTCYPLGARLGLGDFLSPRATRLACLAVATWSFAVAADRLDELAGVRIDDETLRRYTEPAAHALLQRREATLPAAASFAAAPGRTEFATDGVMAPSRSGWREVKLAIFQKRPDGLPAEPAEWATRTLPSATATVAFARLEDCDRFAARWGGWAEQLGMTADEPLTVLGDGAAWIWNRAVEQFPKATQLLDIFHATEHVAAAERVLFGEGTGAGRIWTDRVRRRLLGDGWPGLCDAVGELVTPGMSEAGRSAVDELVGYFAGQSSRLGYYARLRSGRSIGSGVVEGLAKRVGRRLKVAGRGWDEGNIDAVATLTIAAHSSEWDDLWKPSSN
jgi:Uncharacterised protein family (UPF0236)